MATNAEIQAAITTAGDLAVTPRQIIQLIDRAIAEALIEGLPTITYAIGGRSVTLGLSEARELRRHYAGLTGPVIQGAEF